MLLLMLLLLLLLLLIEVVVSQPDRRLTSFALLLVGPVECGVFLGWVLGASHAVRGKLYLLLRRST